MFLVLIIFISLRNLSWKGGEGFSVAPKSFLTARLATYQAATNSWPIEKSMEEVASGVNVLFTVII